MMEFGGQNDFGAMSEVLNLLKERPITEEEAIWLRYCTGDLDEVLEPTYHLELLSDPRAVASYAAARKRSLE